MEVGNQRKARPFYPWKIDPYPLYRRLGGQQGWSERVRKILRQPRFKPRTVQAVVSRYADCVVPARHVCYMPHRIVIFTV